MPLIIRILLFVLFISLGSADVLLSFYHRTLETLETYSNGRFGRVHHGVICEDSKHFFISQVGGEGGAKISSQVMDWTTPVPNTFSAASSYAQHNAQRIQRI
jgi:hypothetical protein